MPLLLSSCRRSLHSPHKKCKFSLSPACTCTIILFFYFSQSQSKGKRSNRGGGGPAGNSKSSNGVYVHNSKYSQWRPLLKHTRSLTSWNREKEKKSILVLLACFSVPIFIPVPLYSGKRTEEKGIKNGRKHVSLFI